MADAMRNARSRVEPSDQAMPNSSRLTTAPPAPATLSGQREIVRSKLGLLMKRRLQVRPPGWSFMTEVKLGS